MSELAKSVEHPCNFYYLLEFVDADPRNLQLFRDRYPGLADGWPDISEYSSDELDEMDALIKKLGLFPLVTDHTKAVPDDDEAA